MVVLVSADLDIGLVLLATESVIDAKSKNDHLHQQGVHYKLANRFIKVHCDV
jgi:hypothetical protein